MILDRDGVINDLVIRRFGKKTAPWTIEEFKLCKNADFALEILKVKGFRLFIATNQPDISTGKITWTSLEAIHKKMQYLIPAIDGIYICPHVNLDNCECRKPKSGLIDQIFIDHQLEKSQTWIIGDRWVDIAAADSLNLRSILIVNDQSWLPNSSGKPHGKLSPTYKSKDLLSAARIIESATI